MSAARLVIASVGDGLTACRTRPSSSMALVTAEPEPTLQGRRVAPRHEDRIGRRFVAFRDQHADARKQSRAALACREGRTELDSTAAREKLVRALTFDGDSDARV